MNTRVVGLVLVERHRTPSLFEYWRVSDWFLGDSGGGGVTVRPARVRPRYRDGERAGSGRNMRRLIRADWRAVKEPLVNNGWSGVACDRGGCGEG